MSIVQTAHLVKLMWSIAKELIASHQRIEEKYNWGKNKGPRIKNELQKKKRDEMDDAIVEALSKHGLPAPDRNGQAWVRERVCEFVGT